MRTRTPNRSGFSLIELLMSMAVLSLVMMGVTATMQSALRAEQTVKQVTAMNTNLRVAMDLIVRDLIQAGQGLPAGLVVTVPSGDGALPIVRPSRVGTTVEFEAPAGTISAVTVGPGLGPVINGVATDMITVLAADNAFDGVPLAALTATSMTVHASVNIGNEPDDEGDNLRVGDLILLEKGSINVLKYVTSVTGQTVLFGQGDPLNLNQQNVEDGTLAAYVAQAPLETPTAGVVPTQATRIRMITYYLEPGSNQERNLRLVRRINNNPPTTVAFFVEEFRITYDLVDGVTNPVDVEMNAADLAGTGACDPAPGTPPVLTCTENQIRKVNVRLTARSAEPDHASRVFFRNSLATQVSLRSLALVNRYQ